MADEEPLGREKAIACNNLASQRSAPSCQIVKRFVASELFLCTIHRVLIRAAPT
jgi:hypothetical protein